MFKPKMIENKEDLIFCSQGHKQQIVSIALDPKLSNAQRLMCPECLENTDIDIQLFSFRKIISFIEENQAKKMEKVENIIMNQIKLIESLYSVFDQMKSNIIQKLNQLNTIMMEWIQNLQQKGSQYSQYSFYEELDSMIQKKKTDSNFEIINNDIQKMNFCWNSILNPKLEQFNQFEDYNKCKELLKSLELDSQKLNQNKQINTQVKTLEIQQQNTKLNIEQSQSSQNNYLNNLKPFHYQIIQESSISQKDLCFALAIDKDCSTLLAGCYSQIKVFELNKGIMKEIQILNGHKNIVFTLNFMKKSKQFVSGDSDKSIIIWEYNQTNLWSQQYLLNGHDNGISCLIININEDLIISGSYDKTIKFWINQNEWLCEQTITDHSGCVYGLSLNQQQNRIVSCGFDKFILIIEQSKQNKEWKVIQKITVEQYGWRVCFIDDNVFTFSPNDKEWISIFEMNNMNQQFTKTRDIIVKCGSDSQCLFPQQYINSKSILISKNGEYVNFIRKKQNGELLSEYSIHFGTYSIFGGMSEDGECLITWDNKSNQIQIRKYKEL